MTATSLILIRHGATAANLEKPYRLQGQRCDDPLAPLGVRQAELTRDALANQPISRFYSSPLRRAVETAKIIAGPRAESVVPLSQLTECDVGRWEGQSWESIETHDTAAYEQFRSDPSVHGYPDGENFRQVADRVIPVFERLLTEHARQTILIVGHHVVNRVYLASLLGLPPSLARQVRLDNCGISIVIRENNRTQIAILNAKSHLLENVLAA
jgi:broad specificity phosphatase PhoE